MNGLTAQEIMDKLDSYVKEGKTGYIQNLMARVLGANIINMDFAFRVRAALNDNDVEAAKGLLSEQAKYLSAIYEQMMESEVIKSILDN